MMKRLITVGLLLAVLAGGLFASHAQTISCNGIPGNSGMIQTSCGGGNAPCPAGIAQFVTSGDQDPITGLPT